MHLVGYSNLIESDTIMKGYAPLLLSMNSDYTGPTSNIPDWFNLFALCFASIFFVIILISIIKAEFTAEKKNKSNL